MPEASAIDATAVWTAPACPFKIEYSLRALDDIRLAVVDAFFSLPRGGAEIGGILLGAWTKGRLTITDYVALDCEHAFGPSFQLSRNDEARLGQLLAAKYSEARVVGWYHSHTRSEIFLSQADLEIQRRFFREPWQVALVLKPHTFQPTRIGFFFREGNGNIRSEASYREEPLTPLPMKPAVGGMTSDAAGDPHAAPVEAPPPALRPHASRENPLVDAAAALAAARHSEVELKPEPAVNGASAHEDEVASAASAHDTYAVEETPAPTFGIAPNESRTGFWPWAFALAMVIALSWAGYATREAWWPKVEALAGHEASPLPPAIGLNVIDREGQLQIYWNAQSPAIARAAGGILRITGSGPFPNEIPLDKMHLQTGSFTYQRQSERVDVALIVSQPSGPPAAAITTFIGKMPDKKPVFLEDPDARREREALASKVTEMQNELNTQIQENRNLRHAMEILDNRLKLQTRKRLTNQDK